jgi:hypothetical protein
MSKGSAIALAAILWIPTAVARVRSHFRLREIYGGQSDTGAGFFRVLRLPLPILIPPTAPYSLTVLSLVYSGHSEELNNKFKIISITDT